MEWLNKFERDSFSPFATVDINGCTDKLQLNGLKPVRLVMPGDSINLGGGPDSFRVCMSLMLPFAVDSENDELHQWDIVVQFRGGMRPYPEYYIGSLTNRMDTPLVFTQSVPLKFSLLQNIKIKALPKITKVQTGATQAILRHLDEALNEAGTKDDKVAADDAKVFRIVPEDLRAAVEKKGGQPIPNSEWESLLRRQTKYSIEVANDKTLVFSDMFSKKKDPCHWEKSELYEMELIKHAKDIIKKEGAMELPVLMELLWTSSNAQLRDATRRVLCPNWKVLKEILLDHNSKFCWITNTEHPHVCLKEYQEQQQKQQQQQQQQQQQAQAQQQQQQQQQAQLQAAHLGVLQQQLLHQQQQINLQQQQQQQGLPPGAHTAASLQQLPVQQVQPQQQFIGYRQYYQ